MCRADASPFAISPRRSSAVTILGFKFVFLKRVYMSEAY